VKTTKAFSTRLADVVALARTVRAQGGRVVFTNGVFDILHPGHVRYLQQARGLGDALIVGVNSDRSVRAIKGPGRPVNTEIERVEILLALSAVDAAVIFDEGTPLELITALEPDILVKGSDWPADQIVGREFVEARGGQVVLMPFSQGHSTTHLIDRVRR
jgi:D-beta-D-heptose 7-phosphate kinase/D-beta-D-heptose 1-phosphate adenosyltransferase